jgi:hypothetical protein
MVAFGAEEALGLLSLATLVGGAALAARASIGQRGSRRGTARIEAKLRDFEEREEINRLRHRDFDAFLRALNERRERLGQPPLAREFLLPHQFNLMYSVDAGDIDEAELEKLRRRVGKAARTGEAPDAPAPPA